MCLCTRASQNVSPVDLSNIPQAIFTICRRPSWDYWRLGFWSPVAEDHSMNCSTDYCDNEVLCIIYLSDLIFSYLIFFYGISSHLILSYLSTFGWFYSGLQTQDLFHHLLTGMIPKISSVEAVDEFIVIKG